MTPEDVEALKARLREDLATRLKQLAALTGKPVTVVGAAHGEQVTIAVEGTSPSSAAFDATAAFDAAAAAATPPQDMLATFSRLASASVLAQDLQRILAGAQSATGLIEILAAAGGITTWVDVCAAAGCDTKGPIPRLLVGALADLGDEAKRVQSENLEARG